MLSASASSSWSSSSSTTHSHVSTSLPSSSSSHAQLRPCASTESYQVAVIKLRWGVQLQPCAWPERYQVAVTSAVATMRVDRTLSTCAVATMCLNKRYHANCGDIARDRRKTAGLRGYTMCNIIENHTDICKPCSNYAPLMYVQHRPATLLLSHPNQPQQCFLTILNHGSTNQCTYHLNIPQQWVLIRVACTKPPIDRKLSYSNSFRSSSSFSTSSWWSLQSSWKEWLPWNLCLLVGCFQE